MSKEEINKEYEKCRKDPVYFLTHYCGFVKKGTDVVLPIKLDKEKIKELRQQ